MKVFRLFVAMVFLAGVGLLPLAADAPKESAADKDLKKIQGKWSPEAVTGDGKVQPAETLKSFSMAIKGNKVTVTFTAKLKEPETFAIKLDPSKTPAHLDAILPGDKGKIVKGIYKIEDDTLTICRADSDTKDRPTEFASKAGSGVVLAVFKRAK